MSNFHQVADVYLMIVKLRVELPRCKMGGMTVREVPWQEQELHMVEASSSFYVSADKRREGATILYQARKHVELKR